MAAAFRTGVSGTIVVLGRCRRSRYSGNRRRHGHPARSCAGALDLAPGVVTVTRGGKSERIFVRGGFAEVNPQGLTVLAEVRCRSPNSMPKSPSRSRMREDDVNDAKTDETRRRAQENLDHLKALDSALQRAIDLYMT